jgi:ADP-ribose pyrophosphatase YjhB (NUDIX family)
LTQAGPHPLVGVSTVVHHDGMILLVERRQAAMAGPVVAARRSCRMGETLRAAAVREVLEETGIEVVIDRLVETIDVINRDDSGLILSHLRAHRVRRAHGGWAAAARQRCGARHMGRTGAACPIAAPSRDARLRSTRLWRHRQ